jgi:hypothetical protein
MTDTTPWPEADPEEFDCLVAPCYLAGVDNGHLLRPVLAPLVEAGWILVSDEDHTIRSISPDRLLGLACHTQSQHRYGWDLYGHATPLGRMLWRATLAPHCPPELITPLATAQATPLPPGHTADDHGMTPLATAGWTASATADAITYTAPDRRVTVHYDPTTTDLDPHEDVVWHAHAQIDPHPPLWQADFTVNTPVHLLTDGAIWNRPPLLRVFSKPAELISPPFV